jgi:sec-independent protein translocase protein TatA
MRPGAWQIIILLAIILLLFGAPKLPELARSIGKSMRILKDETKQLVSDDEASESEQDDDAQVTDASSDTAPSAKKPAPKKPAAKKPTPKKASDQ